MRDSEEKSETMPIQANRIASNDISNSITSALRFSNENLKNINNNKGSRDRKRWKESENGEKKILAQKKKNKNKTA